ncbi:hypothetical protein Rhe02_39230 [Rhizocola hellebori]|uniref:Uncharacterized protein n=1 Tax=Rhizocola hellebori TaxID=1392758 RepID=A0A8J3QA03_9ACTN|nr:hypothetical protein Rhe02_39230 [Rhizocola hellebori]
MLEPIRESLVPLWSWATPQFALLPKGGTAKQLPIWYGRRTLTTPESWTDLTLALADGLIYHVALELTMSPGLGRIKAGAVDRRAVKLPLR